MKTDKPEAVPATCQREALCTVCGKSIPADTECFWIADKGLIHPECLETFEAEKSA